MGKWACDTILGSLLHSRMQRVAQSSTPFSTPARWRSSGWHTPRYPLYRWSFHKSSRRQLASTCKQHQRIAFITQEIL